MRHDVRGTGLPRKLKIFARQHVAIQSQSQFHINQIQLELSGPIKTATRNGCPVVKFGVSSIPQHGMLLTAP